MQECRNAEYVVNSDLLEQCWLKESVFKLIFKPGHRIAAGVANNPDRPLGVTYAVVRAAMRVAMDPEFGTQHHLGVHMASKKPVSRSLA